MDAPTCGTRWLSQLLLTATVIAVGMIAVTKGPSAVASTSISSPALPAATSGALGLRLLDAPLSAGNDPRARLYIVDHLAPRTVIKRRVEVSNTMSTPVHAVLYSAAASIAKGSFVGADAHTPNDLSSWTAVAPGAVKIPARGQVTAVVTIAVPDDAAPGEQYAVVWAEVRITDSAGGSGVVQVNRVGIRIYLSVGPGGPPPANFTIDSLTAERSTSGDPLVVATVHNTGGRALDMHGALQLSDGPAGLRAGPFKAVLGTTLAIGDTEPVAITLDKQIPAGPWNAQVNLACGLVQRSAAATITFPAAGTAAPAMTQQGPPWIIIMLVVMVLLLLGTIYLLVRVRRRRTTQPNSQPAREATKDP